MGREWEERGQSRSPIVFFSNQVFERAKYQSRYNQEMIFKGNLEFTALVKT